MSTPLPEFTIVHHALVLFLVIGMPIWDRYETKLLKATTDPRARLKSYGKTISWQIVATTLLLATLPPAMLFHSPVPPTAFASMQKLMLPIAIGLASGLLIPFILAWIKPSHREVQAKQLEPIAFFLPRTRNEKLLFALMCVTVGICEEVIFRGFLIRYAAGLPIHLGWTGAIAVAAVIFGVDHGYQGIIGILSTTVLALVFTLFFVGSGTLLVPMVVHALIDLRILAMLRT